MRWNRIWFLLAALFTLCALCSCREKEAALPEDGIFLYFVDAESGTGSILARELYSGAETPTVRVLTNALLAGPTQESLRSPIPAQTSLRSWNLENGLLTLDLSEHYGGLSGIDLTLADYCITLTLCQIDRVERVRILVAGEELAYRAHPILDPSEAVMDGLLGPLEIEAAPEKNDGTS